MVKIGESQHGGLLTVGLLGALWSSSAAMVAIVSAMNRAYDIDEGRRWWKVRLTAIGLTISLSFLIVFAFTLIVAGPEMADAIGKHLPYGFRYYAVNFGNYEATYGTVGGVILLMLWFYITGFVIVIGAEMNAEIEHASPWGKAPGEKVPGTRKKIGLA